MLSRQDLLIAIVLMLVFLFGFKPAVNNFLVVLDDRANPRVTPLGRRFVLFWLGLGLVCMALAILVIAYSIGAHLGFLPDFKVGFKYSH